MRPVIVECQACQRRYDMSGRPAGTQAHCRCGAHFLLPEPPCTARAMECPNCGGNVPSDSTECQYCDAALAIRACPRCFGMVFLGAEFCRACGSKIGEPAHVLSNGHAPPRKCPRCQPTSRLESQLLQGLVLDACTDCYGVFVDVDLLDRFLTERRHQKDSNANQRLEELLAHRSRRAKLPGQIVGLKRDTSRIYIKCPDCDGNMLRRNFGKRSGVVVDICTHHGTWFDADELEQVIAFVQGGGLDKDPSLSARPGLGGVHTVQRKQLNYGVRGVRPAKKTTGFFERSLDALRSLFSD